MKSSQLIALLQELDPSGEVDVVVGGLPIFYVEGLEGYYDGAFQRLVLDHEKKGFNVSAIEIRRDGSKIDLHTLSVEDAIKYDPDMPITFHGCNERHIKSWTARIDAWRANERELRYEGELSLFQMWASERGHDTEAAVAFFKASNMQHSDPLPSDLKNLQELLPDGTKVWSSWLTRRFAQWDREVKVEDVVWRREVSA